MVRALNLVLILSIRKFRGQSPLFEAISLHIGPNSE